MDFFSADFHGFHKNICKQITTWESGALRDYNDPKKMTWDLIQNINKKVGVNDTLYFLGDWIFGGEENITILRGAINCKNIHMIYGNHDEKIIENPKYQKLFSSTQFYLEKQFSKTLFCMMHYPLGSWNKIRRGAINLYGHCHGSYEWTKRGKQMDVGVDTNNMNVYSLDDIFRIMDKIPIYSPDHHQPRK